MEIKEENNYCSFLCQTDLEVLDFVDVDLFVLFFHSFGACFHGSYSILRVLERLNRKVSLTKHNENDRTCLSKPGPC